MSRVLILGAGGHAQVVCDILARACEAGVKCHPIGFLDDDTRLVGATLMGLPVLATIAHVHEFAHDAVVVAIGHNDTRARLFALMRAQGVHMVNAIHPTAVLAPDVRLGEGVVICAGVVVNTGAVIGDNVILNTACSVDHHDRIGPHAHVAPGSHLGGHVEIGEGVLVGIGTSVIPGRSIGDWAIVGAGSVVTRDIPPCSTAVGVPARVIRRHAPWR